MKRIISLLLALSVVFGTAVSFAAESDETKKNVSAEAYLLEKLEVLPYAADEENEPIMITRAEFCYMTAKLMGAAEITQTPNNPFDDVTPDTDYADYILYLHDEGIVSGTGSGFSPNDSISMPAALKILLDILGYGYAANSMGGYPNGYIRVAGDIDLTDGIKSYSELSRADCTKLLYNALTTDYEDIIFGTTYAPALSDNSNILGKTFNLEERKGRMTANTKTALTKVKKNSLLTVTIDGTDYRVDSREYDELLGCKVKYYADMDTDELIYMTPVDNCQILNVNLDDVSDKDNRTGYVKYYTDSRRLKSITVSPEADYIVNGAADPDFKLSDMTESMGSVTFIDYDNDNKYDVVSYKHFYNFVVESYSPVSGILRGKNNRELDFSDDSDVVFCTITDAEGKEVALTELNEYDVLSVYCDAGRNYYEIYHSNDIAAGTTKSMKYDDGWCNIVMDEKLYRIYPDETDVDTSIINVGDDCIFYLDYLGRIAYIDIKTLTDYLYGFITDAPKEDEENETCFVKLMTQNANLVKYKVAKKPALNGKRASDDGTRYEPMNIMKNPVFYKNGEFLPQIIKYKLNKNGEITDIHTADAADSEIKLGASLTGVNSRWMTNQKAFYFRYPLADNAVIFKVPDIVNGSVDTNKIDVLSVSELVGSRRYEGTKVYDCNEVNEAMAAVIPANAIEVSGNNIFVVQRRIEMIDENDEHTVLLTGWTQGIKTEYMVSPDAADALATAKTLKIGDVIGAITNTSGKIVGIEVFLKAASASAYVNNETNRASTPYQTCGYVIAKDGNKVKVKLNGIDDDVYVLSDTTNVYMADLSEKTVVKAERSDIVPQKASNVQAYTFYKFYNDRVYDVVIIKK